MQERSSFWPKYFSQEFRCAFTSAFWIGIVVHIYVFTNLLINHDSVRKTYLNFDSTTERTLGRWALTPFSKFSTGYQMPVVIGLLSILMLSFTAALTVELLDLKERALIILASGLMVSFPSVSCIFSYMFTADAYFIALALNTLAVYICQKNKKYGLFSVLLLAVACGIYQAFTCYAIGLFLFLCIVRLFREEPLTQVIKTGLFYVIVIISGFLLYFVITKLTIYVYKVPLSSYQDISSMSLGQYKDFLAAVPRAYSKFFEHFLFSGYRTTFYQMIQDIFMALGILASIFLIIVKKIYKHIPELIALVLGILLIPLALNFITVYAVNATVHSLMIYSFVLFYVMILKIAEMAFVETSEKWKLYMRKIAMVFVLLSALLVWNNFCISNEVYLRMTLTYENSFALANRIVARIEALEDYSEELPILIAGYLPSSDSYEAGTEKFLNIQDLAGTNDSLIYAGNGLNRLQEFLKNYIGFKHTYETSAELLEKIESTDSFNRMGTWPANDSIAIIDGVIVVKLSE